MDQQSPFKWAARYARAFPPRPIYMHRQSVCQSEDDYLYIEYSVYTNGLAILLAAAAAVGGGGEERIEACSFLSITNRDKWP